MIDEDRYARVLARLAADPDIALGELAAKLVAQRWMTDHGGWTIWDGEPFINLDAWADDDPRAEWLSESVLIAEAERMLSEITDPARVQEWAKWDPNGSPETAAIAVRALIRHLRDEPATYASIADWIYHDIDADTEISEREAKTIAEGWASDGCYPALASWVDGHDVPTATLVAEARELWSDLNLCWVDWPHEGEPEPSIAAVGALTEHLVAREG
ncbi:hypothetical protein [Nocardia fluminea]|uniref:hypothetical protein n=1 Tax=Nocardia fluminea TaxID=134984 RepID=UPI003D0FB856